MRVATGTYIGTGSSQSITGLGFTPVFVITRNQTTASRATALKTSAMPSTRSITWDQASGDFAKTTGITSLDSDGFTVLSDLSANQTSATYHWMAFGADAAVMFNHAFTGDDVDGRQFTGLGFMPDILLGSRSTPSGRHWGWWFQSLGGDATLLVPADQGPDTDRFQAALSTGYEVGAFNNFLSTAHYTTGLKITSGNVAQASFTGNGTSQSISGLGFRPKIVFIRKSTFPNQRTIYRQDTDTVTYKMGTSDVASGITSIDSDGFSVGSAAEANASGGTYHYLAIGDETPVATMNIATGSYTAVGGGESITGLGFAPVVVLVQQKEATASDPAVMKTSSMSGTDSAPLGGVTPFNATGITSLDADGFTVAAQLDETGKVYEWVALSADAVILHVGTYTGDGSSPRDIGGVSFRPDYVFIMEDGSNEPTIMHFDSFGGDNAWRWGDAGTNQTGKILGVTGDGFTVSSGHNVLGRVFHYFALRIAPGVVEQVKYVGNGADNRNIAYAETNFGPPDFLLIQSEFGVTSPVWRSSSPTLTGDVTMRPGSTSQPEANLIQNMLAATFQVGSNAAVNGSATDQHYLALKGVPIIPEGETIDPLELEGAILGECFDAPTGERRFASALPFDVRGGFGISQLLPAEMLRRLSFVSDLPMEPNATTLVVGSQLLPIETLVQNAFLKTIMPIEWGGTTPVGTATRLPIEMLERLALAGQLPVSFISSIFHRTDALPVEFMQGVGTSSRAEVDFVGTFRVTLTPNLEIEFVAGTTAPTILPVDAIGTTIITATPNLPIESLLQIMMPQIVPVEFAGTDQALLLVFNIRTPFTEGAEFPLQFVIVPVAITGFALPITFNITQILGNTLNLSWRILPDKIITLFDDDIQWPFGRADKT